MDGYGRGDSRAGSRGAPRPDCVPALDLGHLADKNNGLRNPVTDYEPKLSPPDTASTVSWGYHDYSTRTSQRGSDSRRPPFALHHAPEPSPHVTGRSQRPEGVPKLNLDGSDDTRPVSAKHQQASRRGPLIPPYHTHENQQSEHVEHGTRVKSGRGQRSPTGVDLERKSEAEKLAESRKREHIIHTVLTDQLSRAAISDPQQNIDDDPASQRPLFGVEQKPKIRNLHYTKVKDTTTGYRAATCKLYQLNARILTRDGHFRS
ncbi:hypothetical protein HOLleu_24563 [Holothuria leucospilota]|uniref:Uncharacterized protein n=1 Tax=Holothuria leucospilota TaxID=206669 RepID=A0A9Q1BRJ2_HOLLE|nr:hypothetical protein HOLleu_24563 [Holothuria leucospilota]